MSMVLASNPTSLVAVDDQCAAVEAWAEQCESIPELRDATNRLAAIDEYLTRTSTEGRGRVAAAMRRLEVRIGQLLGPSPGPGGVNDHNREDRNRDVDLHSSTKSDFRAMAANEGLVEDVIAQSTDERPASRRSVTDRIKAAAKSNPLPADPPRNLPISERAEQIRSLAARNFTSPQIADEIGVSAQRVRDLARRLDVEIPADAVFGGKFRKVDPNRVIATIVENATPEPTTLAFVAYSELDRDRLDEWVSSLTGAIKSLTTIKRNIEKELTRDHEG
jgi:hypothetical protein